MVIVWCVMSQQDAVEEVDVDMRGVNVTSSVFGVPTGSNITDLLLCWFVVLWTTYRGLQCNAISCLSRR